MLLSGPKPTRQPNPRRSAHHSTLPLPLPQPYMSPTGHMCDSMLCLRSLEQLEQITPSTQLRRERSSTRVFWSNSTASLLGASSLLPSSQFLWKLTRGDGHAIRYLPHHDCLIFMHTEPCSSGYVWNTLSMSSASQLDEHLSDELTAQQLQDPHLRRA